MAIPTYSARPISITFLLARLLQTLFFTLLIYLTASHTSQLLSISTAPPVSLIVTLTIASLAAFYTLLSLPFYWAKATRSLMIMALIDALMAIAFAVVAIVVGRPVSYLECGSIGVGFTSSITNSNKDAGFLSWAEESKRACWEVKIVWGGCIGLSVLFLCTALVLPALFAKQKRALRVAAKSGV